jgi:hypothetical protein
VEGKLRLTYDMAMLNILLETEGGRKKLTNESINYLK